MTKKQISILGATGSIGLQTLEVLSSLPEMFDINFVTANKNMSVLEQICFKHNPKAVVIADEKSYHEFKSTTSYKGEIFCGNRCVAEAAAAPENDLVLSALVGFSGVIPTLSAVSKGINVALANKESLVSAGSIIMPLAEKNNAKILAVDSEHSAILQCIAGESHEAIEKIILTASGGPFLNTPLAAFKNLSVEEALNHPNWTMGNKVTIDSATMMNKGFEIIEAYWLFGIDLRKIEVVIHPQSIIHSFVQFTDGSVKAQLGKPDMRLPISYALTYPKRYKYDFERLNLLENNRFDFIKPDLERYPCLKLAFSAIEKAGNATAVLNAANEICVSAFLNNEIAFTDIHKIIEKNMERMNYIEDPNIDDIIQTDVETRKITLSFIKEN